MNMFHSSNTTTINSRQSTKDGQLNKFLLSLNFCGRRKREAQKAWEERTEDWEQQNLYQEEDISERSGILDQLKPAIFGKECQNKPEHTGAMNPEESKLTIQVSLNSLDSDLNNHETLWLNFLVIDLHQLNQ